MKKELNKKSNRFAKMEDGMEQAHSLLGGNAGMTSKYGAIHYYEDLDIEKWRTGTISRQL